VIDNYLLFGVAITNMITGVFAFITLVYARRTEKNTNSMKDALVVATETAAYSRGVDEERVRGKLEAATLAQGALAVTTVIEKTS
jgi:hypothetical protein